MRATFYSTFISLMLSEISKVACSIMSTAGFVFYETQFLHYSKRTRLAKILSYLARNKFDVNIFIYYHFKEVTPV